MLARGSVYDSRRKSADRTFSRLIPACVFAGLVLGFIFAGLFGHKGFDRKLTDIMLINVNTIGSLDLFLESFLKYGKYAAIIWAMAFIPRGFLISLLTLLIRGFGYGYTTGLLFSSFGGGGIKYVILLYLPQMLLSFFGYYFAARASFRYSSINISKAAYSKGKPDGSGISGYILILLAALALEASCALIEVKVTRSLLLFV